MNDKKKQQVEKYILAAMKSLDKANAMIGYYEEYSSDYREISEAKALIKRVLNRHYDLCARQTQANQEFYRKHRKPVS